MSEQWQPRAGGGGKPSLWRRFRMWPTWAQVATWVAVVAIIAGAAGSGQEDEGEQVATQAPITEAAEVDAPTTEAPTTTARATTSTTAAGPRTSFGSGTHRVGTDIAPGTYRNSGGSSSACYWARLSGFGGGLGEIIANNLGGGQQVVTIAATDAGFESRNCGTWERV